MFVRRFITTEGEVVPELPVKPDEINQGSPGPDSAGWSAAEGSPLSEMRLRAMLDASPDGILVAGRGGIIHEINPAGLAMLEVTGMQQIGDAPLMSFVAPEHREAFGLCLEALWRGEQAYAEFECTGCNGRRSWVEMHGAPLREPGGEAIAFLGILRDNTARRDLGEQFIQAQKMEAMGHLAGGVAHDLNNMLGIVMGCTEMMMDGLTPDSPEHRHAQTIFHTAENAAALTRQLLIFSRKWAES